MILLTWNLAGRISKIPEQLKAISRHKADILAFQEVTTNSKEILREYLLKQGYEYIVDSFSLSTELKKLTGKRKYGQMIASKYPLKPRSPMKFKVPWKERVLSVDVITDFGKIELHTTHIPPGASNGEIKIKMFEGIYEKLNRKTKKLRILCGDFNTPKFETKDGTVITWGQGVKYNGDEIKEGYIIKSWGKRWDEGERNVIEKLKSKNLIDIYRKIHGYDKQDYSWYVNHSSKTGRRFDHIFASAELKPVKCYYDHNVREKGLSDHSAMVGVFEPLIKLIK